MMLRRAPVPIRAAAMVLVAGLLSAGGSLAAPARATPAVEIPFEQDAAHRLVVRYQAPVDVEHLDFLLIDDRMDSAFRAPFMRPANGCGRPVPRGMELRHGAGCEQGAVCVEAGFDGRASVALTCPTPMPALSPQVVLPDDVLARLGLSTRLVAATSN